MTSVWEGAFNRQGVIAHASDPWLDRDIWIRDSSEFVADDNPETSWSDSDGNRMDSDNEDAEGREVRAEQLAEEFEREAAEQFSKRGFEALAWYAPISFFGSRQWGIYFHEPRFWGYCQTLQRQVKTASLMDISKEVYHMLDRHESFHAAVELYALIAHDQGAAPGLPSGENLYGTYFKNEYIRTFGTSGCIEESLATAAHFHRPGFRVAGLKQVVKRELLTALSGYREWVTFRELPKFRQGVFELTTQRILSQTPHGTAHVNQLTHGSNASYRQQADGWWFPPTNPKKLNALGPIPHYATRSRGKYTKLFSPSILGNRKMRDVRRFARDRYGATVSRGHAKHSNQLVFPNNKVVPLPSTKGVPHYVIEQIAVAVCLPKQEVLREFGFL